ncbi:Uncharacterised protein [Escherichia coli]|uniref:Uncharacterized protein n=1 Tax=Escherichia coli TaxID=562 RepID=A0A377KCZ5_ECOLX|nr:Uncharacterised protein [Escherichia coli]
MKVLAPLIRIFLTQPVFSKTKPLISGMSPTASVSPPMPSRQNAVRELFLLTVRRPTAPASAILSSSPASLPCQMKKLAPGDPTSPILKGDNEMKRTAKAIPVQVCLIVIPAAGYSPAATSSPANPFLRYKVVLVTTDYPPVLLCLSWSSPPGEIRLLLLPSRLCH